MNFWSFGVWPLCWDGATIAYTQWQIGAEYEGKAFVLKVTSFQKYNFIFLDVSFQNFLLLKNHNEIWYAIICKPKQSGKKPKQKSEKYRLRINHYFRLHGLLHLGLSEPGPQILTEQFTLSQRGGRFCPPNCYLPPPPRIFRPSYGPERLHVIAATMCTQVRFCLHAAGTSCMLFAVSTIDAITSFQMFSFRLPLSYEVQYQWNG